MPLNKKTHTVIEETLMYPAKDLKVVNTEEIKQSEGLSLRAYLPTKNDVWTIGWGHTKGVKANQVITLEQAEVFLQEDLAWVNSTLQKLDVPLTQNMYDALASLVFNIGASAFDGSTVKRKLLAKDYLGAADAFLMWNKQTNKATGQKEELKGLTLRRQRERSLFLDGYNG